MTLRTSLPALLLGLTVTAARADAQCSVWDSGFHGASLTDAPVRALCVFDDGTGPVLVAAGDFSTIGGVVADAVARWDGTSWASVNYGSGYQEYVQALFVFDVGDGGGPAMYAGGYFPHQSLVYPTVVRWYGGTNWNGIPGLGPWTAGSRVNALTGFDDGSGTALYVGGHFSTAGGLPVQNIARWDGSSWTSPGSGLSGDVFALAVFDDGSGPALYAGGAFTTAGGVPANHVARWNGTSWSALGTGPSGDVYTLTGFDDGSGPALFAGGAFSAAGGVSAPNAARWNGSSWSAFGAPGSGMNSTVRASVVFDSGDGPKLYAGGAFTIAGGVSATRVARWDGSAWSGLGSGTSNTVAALCPFDDGSDGDADLYVGAGSFGSGYVDKWHGCGTTAFCFGDGTSGACPCFNGGQAGHGCANSVVGAGALLAATGTTAPDTLTLTQTGELASALSIFLQGDVQLPAAVPFGDGLRCIGGSLKRLYVKNASAGTTSAPGAGDPSIRARSAALGDVIPPGSARFYQVYYRDPDPAFCPAPQGNNFNVGNALRISWSQ